MATMTFACPVRHEDAETNSVTALYFVVGSSSDSVGAWTGTISGITEYFDGLSLIYVPLVAGGSSSTTLDINFLGAKPCYRTGTSALTTTYPAGTPILLTYRDDAWRRADYNTNTTYSAQTSALLIAGTDTSNRTISANVLKASLTSVITNGQINGHLSVYDGDVTVYTLPTASASVSGGIKVGTNLSIDSSGVLSAVDTTYSAITEAEIDALFA